LVPAGFKQFCDIATCPQSDVELMVLRRVDAKMEKEVPESETVKPEWPLFDGSNPIPEL
jgi:hypothetical protein